MTKEQYKDAINGLEKYSDFLRARIEEIEYEKSGLAQIVSLEQLHPLRWRKDELDDKMLTANSNHLRIRIKETEGKPDVRLMINEEMYHCQDLEHAQSLANDIIKNIVKEAIFGRGF